VLADDKANEASSLPPYMAQGRYNRKPADDPFVPIAHNNLSCGIKLSAPGSTQRVNERSGVTGNNEGAEEPLRS
jgi:hypothetical protein